MFDRSCHVYALCAACLPKSLHGHLLISSKIVQWFLVLVLHQFTFGLNRVGGFKKLSLCEIFYMFQGKFTIERHDITGIIRIFQNGNDEMCLLSHSKYKRSSPGPVSVYSHILILGHPICEHPVETPQVQLSEMMNICNSR